MKCIDMNRLNIHSRTKRPFSANISVFSRKEIHEIPQIQQEIHWKSKSCSKSHSDIFASPDYMASVSRFTGCLLVTLESLAHWIFYQ